MEMAKCLLVISGKKINLVDCGAYPQIILGRCEACP
jgi:hypothetical protein